MDKNVNRGAFATEKMSTYLDQPVDYTGPGLRSNTATRHPSTLQPTANNNFVYTVWQISLDPIHTVTYYIKGSILLGYTVCAYLTHDIPLAESIVKP